MNYRTFRITFQALLCLGIIWVGLFFSGCATLNENECINADWRSIGYEDGARGFKTSRIGAHRKACAEYDITPDFEAYERGRRQGLQEWCTPQNGYALGVRGKLYNGVCPKALEPAYLEAYNQGKAVFAYSKELNIQEKKLKGLYTDLDTLDKMLADKEARLIGDNISPRRRKKLLKEIRMVEKDRRMLLHSITDQENYVAEMQENLAQMQSQKPFQ